MFSNFAKYITHKLQKVCWTNSTATTDNNDETVLGGDPEAPTGPEEVGLSKYHNLLDNYDYQWTHDFFQLQHNLVVRWCIAYAVQFF